MLLSSQFVNINSHQSMDWKFDENRPSARGERKVSTTEHCNFAYRNRKTWSISAGNRCVRHPRRPMCVVFETNDATTIGKHVSSHCEAVAYAMRFGGKLSTFSSVCVACGPYSCARLPEKSPKSSWNVAHIAVLSTISNFPPQISPASTDHYLGSAITFR